VVLNRHGQVVAEGKVRTNRAGLEKQFGHPACRIAIEAGCHSPWVSRLLAEMGHEVIVANPRQVALIARNQRKTDRLDALRLARLARSDPQLLNPIAHRSEQAQADLELLRAREQLVQARTALINHVRAAVKSVGERLPACSAPSFHQKVDAPLPPGLRAALEPMVAIIAQLTQEIRGMDKQVLSLIRERYPAARGLMAQINGVGPLSALAFILTIEDVTRFARSRDVGAYLGLTRRQRDSGESSPQLHISKAGDHLLRRLLVQCAHYILGPFGADCDLRRWGLALAGRAGKKRAITAIARKLAVLMHSLWSTGEVYEPLRRSQASAAA
jgi:transposase